MKKIKQTRPNRFLEFIKRPFRFIWRNKWKTFLLLVIIGGAFYFTHRPRTNNDNFITTPITRGNLKQVVTATGEIRPLNTIKVGSQVSGIIEEIYVDFNDKVKKDQVLLRIDPSVLQATVNESKAALDSAIVTRNFDRAEMGRSQTLFKQGFIARSEMEQAETRFKTSEESVRRAQSQYDRAVTNLNFATITSPVDGTVISRRVDRGQTVAASFQAPDLFEIAEDLSQMRIETSVSEADIGVIKEGQNVTFTVDAYPSQVFDGIVRQIRLSPSTVSNVVIYTTIIDVDNSDLRLMPGMTAFVTIAVAEKEDVWKALNSAFLVRNFNGVYDDPCIKSGDCTPRNTLLIERGGNVVLVPYKRGLVTATETEIVVENQDMLKEGDKIITGKVGVARGNATGGQIGQRGGMGGGGGGMGGGGRR
ncbi:MAG: efflux RND transporter periplasmic adaptor subunit [Alphaproteobacteria bacterium]|nr:efflux RND transporter periplasmic adaptor subunit [Alphaproteobacteria bacterium]